MALTIPHYIEAASIQDPSILYFWDDWKQVVEPMDKDFLAQLKGVTQRANIGFTNGAAEWIVHRFAKLCDNPLPLQYLEAAWAMMVDVRYCGAVWDDCTDSGAWTGPVLRPLVLSMIRVEYSFEAILEYGNPEISGAWITNLAKYVITDPEPYLRWQDHVMEKLKILYPLTLKDQLGEMVPREVLDPDFDFKVEQTEFLINQFLDSLDHKSNPFLNSPEVMVEQGFEGTPYVFDIEADRKSRRT
ncbi:MAG: hypothetical protein PVI66_10605 [Candidatus Aminicenantes bacterium]|jgi:hypothetical protein